MEKKRITLDLEDREQDAVALTVTHLEKIVGESNVSQAIRWLIREGVKAVKA